MTGDLIDTIFELAAGWQGHPAVTGETLSSGHLAGGLSVVRSSDQ